MGEQELIIGNGTRKVCPECNRALSTEYDFDQAPRYPDGLFPLCKECAALKEREAHLREIQQRVDQLDNASIKVLDEISRLPSREIVSLPHMAHLLEDLTTVWGGTRQFAQHVIAQYLAAPPGGMMRQKCLEMYERTLRKASEANYTQKPLNSMTDEELEQERISRLRTIKAALEFQENDRQVQDLSQTRGSAPVTG
jgi:hypothetical protein